MEAIPESEPTIEVRETADGMLDVIIRTIDDVALEALRESDRRAPKRVH